MPILPLSTGLVPAKSTPTWQRELADAVRDVDQLCQSLGLSRSELKLATHTVDNFPLLVPRGYLARMRPGDPDDPLLRQVLPLAAESENRDGFVEDPVGDAEAEILPGVLRKYQGRALIVATGACAVHCRYCFRRNYPYDRLPRYSELWEAAAQHIASDLSLHEVILSGGDPLTLSDDRLSRLALRLSQIPHVRRLRVHTRLPILIPQRVNDELLAWLCGTSLVPLMVIHANHPAELDDAVARAIGRLVDAGVPVLNQAVLLRGVNDCVEVLTALCERLVDLRVMPYYLHQLDRVLGAAHFAVPQAIGERLLGELRNRLPGYAVPRYVREVPAERSKTLLA